MSDWQVDLALCVNAGRIEPRCAAVCDKLSEGKVYRVAGCWPDPLDFALVILLEGVRSIDPHSGGAFLADRFRKIRPDEHEACEPEFVTLLKRTKVAA
jgi:hypothetical protein